MRRFALVIAVAAGAAAAVALTAAGVGHNTQGVLRAARYEHGQLSVGGAQYSYSVYVPSSVAPGSRVPLVVLLHGCTTSADQQSAASGYNPLAQKHRFVVLYPDVDAADAINGRCWRGIWDPNTETRGHGDAAAIAAMTRAAIGRWHIDPDRVYAIGMSAGAFETAILGADYPDLYAAIGIHSGAAYLGGELGCLTAKPRPSDTTVLARAALTQMGARARVMPVIVLHGDRDERVPYRCGRQALAQWLATDRLALRRARLPALPSSPSRIVRATVPGGHSYTVSSYTDRGGCLIAQLWTIHGMGHAWSGGSPSPRSARFTDPRGPSAAAASWAFFSRWRLARPAQKCSRASS
jgi:poly(hydroxyalkanoate) depolymerase family esterase